MSNESGRKHLSHRSQLWQSLGHPDGYLVGMQEEKNEKVVDESEYRQAQEDLDLMENLHLQRKKGK